MPALCPVTGGQKSIKLMADLVRKLMTEGPQTRVYDIIGDRNDPTCGSPVQEVLLKPIAVFEHIREHQKGGMCYCGIPTCRYTIGGAKVPPPPNMVYCVYINPGDRFFESRWEPADPDHEGLPLGYQTRYKMKIWPKQ